MTDLWAWVGGGCLLVLAITAFGLWLGRDDDANG